MVETKTFYYIQNTNGHSVRGGLQFTTCINRGRWAFSTSDGVTNS